MAPKGPFADAFEQVYFRMTREWPSPTPKLPGVITVAEFAEAVLRHVPAGDIRVVMDLGAMDGGDTIEMHRRFPWARTIAVEALASNFEQYLSWLPGVEAHCAVIGGRDAVGSFFEKSVNGVHSLYERETQDTVRVHAVRVETLASFCGRIGISGLDVLKIDVEGGTLDVLEGSGDLLGDLKALHVETEAVPFFRGQRLDTEVTGFLSARGFEMILREGRVGTTGHVVGQQYDSVWIRKGYLSPAARPRRWWQWRR